MALALPLLIPFAEAAGIAIGTLTTAAGLDILSSKVEEYIEDNPENAQKIFAMIMPEQGLANILKNESSEGDEISEEELGEIEKPKLTGKEKSEKIKAAIRRARGEKGLPARGNYSSPDAEGSAVDIRGSVIREVEDMGMADKDLKDKPYKEKGYDFRDYIPKGAYRKRKADGGIMGGNKTYHQVRDQFMPMDSESMGYANGGGVGSMMQPKRVNFRGGGSYQGGSGVAGSAESKGMGGSGSSYSGNGGYSSNNNPSGNVNYGKAARDFVQTLNNNNAIAANKAGTKFTPYDGGSRPQGGIFSNMNFNPLSLFASLIGGPLAGLAMRGITGLKGGFKGFNEKMRGINPLTGEANTQEEYEQARYDRQQVGRLDKLYAAKDRGYNTLTPFGKFKTTDFTPGQQAKIDMLEQNYDPTTARNVDSGRGSGLRNTLAANNITNNNMKSQLFDPKEIQSLIDNKAALTSNATPYTRGSVSFDPSLGNTQPQELSMMEQYYNDIDKKATGPNIVPDASTLAQQAKVFGLQDLQGIGALEKGKVFGYNTTDQGDALEKFRENATSMNQGEFYKGANVQSLFDQLITNENKNATQNQDYLQNVINQGFLKNQSDFTDQKSLEDFT